MMKRKSGLGKGLDALLSIKDIEQVIDGQHINQSNNLIVNDDNMLLQLPLAQLKAGKYQPRKTFDEHELQELADSIKQNGLIQPIIVRKLVDDNYEIIAGERRFRASKLANLQEIPVIVRQISDEEALAFALIENIQRKDLNIIEEAMGFKRLIDEFNLTHDNLAKITGKSRSNISNILRLLNLDSYVIDKLSSNQLDMGHARALLSLPSDVQVQFTDEIIANKLTTAEVERNVARYLHNKQFGINQTETDKALFKKDSDILRLEELLADKIGMTVDIKHNKKGCGKLTIAYSSIDELEGFLQKVKLTGI